ncbi:MAG: sigma-54-dependent Fis family transcriptional regulator [Planctomycetota bacterium]|nr:MAG: sigma-54-dependent Fis family transcriptional regulator [Planctomycetota bacterium]
MLDVLIVEDDTSSREALEAWFWSHGLSCRSAANITEGRAFIEERSPDLAVLDLELPDGSGLDLLRELNVSRNTEVVMASGRGTLDAAIEALRLGARDFLTKPVDLPRLESILRSVVQAAELRAEVASLRTQLKTFGRFGDLLGSSAAMREVYDMLERVAPTSETVLITGATGTGKEVTAATIHKLSPRAKQPFVAVNCGAVAANLMESEFFGHERGSFTGAQKRHKGVFERAHGGTLFLDEVTEMPAELQVKLLRVIESRRVTRLGGTEEIEVDVRLLAATNRIPEAAVDDGNLRQDLLYRLNIFPVNLPDLADRDDDVLMLARAFLEALNEEHETGKSFSASAERALRAHDWPGNVRELLHTVRRAHLLADAHIEASHLPFEQSEEQSTTAPDDATPGSSAAPAGALQMHPGMSIAEAEKRLIQATLDEFDGNKKRSAESLGISLKTLYARLKVYAAQDS